MENKRWKIHSLKFKLHWYKHHHLPGSGDVCTLSPAPRIYSSAFAEYPTEMSERKKNCMVNGSSTFAPQLKFSASNKKLRSTKQIKESASFDLTKARLSVLTKKLYLFSPEGTEAAKEHPAPVNLPRNFAAKRAALFVD